MSNNEFNLLIDEDNKCSCKGNNLDRLIQPAILVILADNELHGYSIIQELELKNLFQGHPPDNTGIYRTLHIMEEKELLASGWDIPETGSAKKIYKITEKGRICLKTWIKTLEQYKDTIDNILKEAKRVCQL